MRHKTFNYEYKKYKSIIKYKLNLCLNKLKVLIINLFDNK